MMQLLTASRRACGVLEGRCVRGRPGRLAVATGDGTGLTFRERRALRKQGAVVIGAGQAALAARPPAGELTDEDLSAALSQRQTS